MKYFYSLFIILSFVCGKVIGQTSQHLTIIADSFYTNHDWKSAATGYETAFSKGEAPTALSVNRLAFSYLNLGRYDLAITDFNLSLKKKPAAYAIPIIESRLARAYAANNEKDKALEQLDSAIAHGYSNIPELDTSKEYDKIRNDIVFKNLRSKANDLLFPCLKNAHAREFDFWIGEWDVYPTRTKTLAGHSLVQMIAGGCALLENWDSPLSTGKSINFIDPNTNKWKQSWSGSYANGNQEFVNGEYKDSAMRFEFETKNAQGNKIIGRFIFYNQGPDQVRQFNETSADNGKTWTTSYDFTYIRKKG